MANAKEQIMTAKEINIFLEEHFPQIGSAGFTVEAA